MASTFSSSASLSLFDLGRNSEAVELVDDASEGEEDEKAEDVMPNVKKILERKYDTDFKIKIVGKGEIPKVLEDLLYTYSDKIILKRNLNFQME